MRNSFVTCTYLKMYYISVIILLSVGNILLEPLENYSIIIIPISNEPRTNNQAQHPLKVRNYANYANYRGHSDRIDVEQYEEPTETTDIDNFDDMKDGEYISRSKENYPGLNRNDVIRYLAARSGLSKNRFKHDENDDEDDKNQDENNNRADQYDMPATYDYESNYGENKIVGGTEVDINLYPYHVAYGTNCGGAIIDKKWVITAGHCGKKPYIRVGSKHVNEGQKIMVKHSSIHPNWPAKNKEHPFDYDFQLLELAEALQFGDNIQPIKIAHIEDMVIGKVITVTGWGNTKENGPYSSVLRAVRVPIISKENCQHVPFPYFRGGLTARMFCAGYSEGKKDACQGDSGGPAVSYDRLVGMVSFGYGCATPGSFGVYSKVAKVRSWIEETTGLPLD